MGNRRRRQRGRGDHPAARPAGGRRRARDRRAARARQGGARARPVPGLARGRVRVERRHRPEP